MKRTKIICTLGPAVDSLEKIEELIRSGMNVARCNFSHGNHEEHQKRMDWVKTARKKLGVPCAIMLDTKGPEIRVGKLLEGKITLSKGQKITLQEKVDGQGQIPIHPVSVIESIHVGMSLLFNDGYLRARVTEKKGLSLVIQMEDSGVLYSGKGVNVPDADLNLPALMDSDIEDLIFGCKMDIDIVAASFIRSSEHILAIKKLLKLHQKADILVIAKIENKQGIEEFKSIVQVSDGIMVARGDLGVEMDPSVVPLLQKMMVRECFYACKPVTIATQMLESMIESPGATRAEVSDVANAVYDGTSSIMLCGESSVGKYPVETLRFMRKIADQAEGDFDNREFYYIHSRKEFPNISSAVASSSVKTAYTLGVKAIFVFTTSGLTARLVSRFKPEMPIIAVTPSKKIFQQLSYFWGVSPLLSSSSTFKESFSLATKYASEQGFINVGDLVIVIAGSEFGLRGSTNMMIVESIGQVLVRGEKGCGKQVEGIVKVFVGSEQQKKEDLQEMIIVLPKCNKEYLPVMKSAKGVVLENHVHDKESLIYAMDMAKLYQFSLIVRADNAFSILEEGERVVMNPKKAVIYRAI